MRSSSSTSSEWHDHGMDQPSPRFLTLDDVAAELALTRTMTYSLIRSGDLPAIQVGPKKVWRIERAELEKYIERQYAAALTTVERGDDVDPDAAH